jgi:exonuclease VII small subunit
MAIDDLGGAMDGGVAPVVENPDLQALEPALAEAEARVDALVKQAGKLNSAIKAWQKATKLGHLANRQKAIAAARKALDEVPEALRAAAGDIDVANYLAGDAWRQELIETLRSRHGIRAFRDPSGALVCPPVVVASDLARSRLRLLSTGFPSLRPSVVADEVKVHRDRVSGANCQEFLEGLYAAAKRLSAGQNEIYAPFHEIYALFADTPGWRKANPTVDFGQRIYALRMSAIRTTKDGRVYQVETPGGRPKEKDIFTVYGEDGHVNRFWGIRFL